MTINVHYNQFCRPSSAIVSEDSSITETCLIYAYAPDICMLKMSIGCLPIKRQLIVTKNALYLTRSWNVSLTCHISLFVHRRLCQWLEDWDSSGRSRDCCDKWCTFDSCSNKQHPRARSNHRMQPCMLVNDVKNETNKLKVSLIWLIKDNDWWVSNPKLWCHERGLMATP